MATTEFPNLPILPGIPALRRSPAYPYLSNIIGGAIQSGVFDGHKTPKWGIFDSTGAVLVVEATCVFSVQSSRDSAISTAPIQHGSFASYHKVSNPYNVTVVLTKTGTEKDRAMFLRKIKDAAKTLDLYMIVTPEEVYHRANIQMIGYSRRNDAGANKIEVEVKLVEIRQVFAVYTKSNLTNNAKNPASASVKNTGKTDLQANSVKMNADVTTKSNQAITKG